MKKILSLLFVGSILLVGNAFGATRTVDYPATFNHATNVTTAYLLCTNAAYVDSITVSAGGTAVTFDIYDSGKTNAIVYTNLVGYGTFISYVTNYPLVIFTNQSGVPSTNLAYLATNQQCVVTVSNYVPGFTNNCELILAATVPANTTVTYPIGRSIAFGLLPRTNSAAATYTVSYRTLN